jgi:hypothetical protein
VETVSTSIDTKGRKQPAKKKKRRKPDFYIEFEENGKRKRIYGEEAHAYVVKKEEEREAKTKRVMAILADRIGIEALTLIAAAEFACSYLPLRDVVDVPGTYGAEVYAKKDDYTYKDFFAKYGTHKSQSPDDGLDIPDYLRREPKAAVS